MSTTMDQIHHIREMYYQQDKNISQIASETGLNRKTISKYVDMEDFNSPPPTPASSEVHESKLDPFKPLIDEWLQADKLAPRKLFFARPFWKKMQNFLENSASPNWRKLQRYRSVIFYRPGTSAGIVNCYKV